MDPRDLNERQGRWLLTHSVCEQAELARAWERLQSQPALDLCDLLERSGRLDSEQVAAAREATGAPRRAGVEVEACISRGGMGAVYRARDLSTGRRVALKLMLDAADARGRARFQREAQSLARLRSPHIAQVLRTGEDEGLPYMVMELVDGEPLSEVVERAIRETGVGLEVEAARRIFREIAEGIAAIHAADLVHRDIKPANIILEAETGRAVIVDFGLARLFFKSAGIGQTLAQSVTQDGEVVGTPAYMAPEQFDPAEFGKVSPAADVWAFAATLGFALSGATPVEGDSAIKIYHNAIAGRVFDLAALRPDLPADLAALVKAGLNVNPWSRPRSDALAKLVRGEIALQAAPRPRRLAIGAVAVGAVAVAAAGLTLWAREEQPPEASPAPVEPVRPRLVMTPSRPWPEVLRFDNETLELRFPERAPEFVYIGGDLASPVKPGVWRVDPTAHSGEVDIVAMRGHEEVARALVVLSRRDFEALADVRLWDQRAAKVKAALAQQVAGALGTDWELRGCERFEVGGVTHDVAVFAHLPSGLLFHLIPGGRCELGVPRARFAREVEALRRIAPSVTDEAARKAVGRSENAAGAALTVAPLLMARTEVPNAVWDALCPEELRVAAAPSVASGPQAPRILLTITQARAWAVAQGWRLPLEEEWEWACGAGQSARYFWGEDPDPARANLDWTDRPDEVYLAVDPEAQARGNAFGLIDMAGNAAEWAEIFALDYHLSMGQGRLGLADEEQVAVCRGGSARNNGWAGTTAYRFLIPPSESLRRVNRIGLRPVCDLPPAILELTGGRE